MKNVSIIMIILLLTMHIVSCKSSRVKSLREEMKNEEGIRIGNNTVKIDTIRSLEDMFKEFVMKFRRDVKYPIEKILELDSKDTLDAVFTNDIIIRRQKVRPKYVDTTGQMIVDTEYFGLYPDEPFRYIPADDDNFHFYYAKIIPIGRINLHENYVSVIIKVNAFECIFYDLWNFTKEGKVLSVVCLFYAIKEYPPRDKELYIIVNSRIDENGDIIWYDNNRGLERFRTYRLNQEGYFQIIKEEQRGEFEY